MIFMNTNKLEEILNNVFLISGMDIAIIDRNRVFARRYAGADYCKYLHKNHKCLHKCLQSDNIHLNFVDEHKELIKYTCPFGIYEAIAPITVNQQVIAYLFLGLGLDDKRSVDEMVELALEIAPELNKETLKELIGKIPCYSTEKLNSFAELLPVIAEYIENNNLLYNTNQSVGQLTKNYIKRNLDKKITLADISYHLHCSTVTVTEHFKEEFGMTVMGYVMEKRMKLAHKMILSDTGTIAEIAEKCGFKDYEYFSRCFKNFYGITPIKWRKQNINNIAEQFPTKTIRG